jgi:hypothetical protein
MINTTPVNPCYRCGKERKIVKKWEEQTQGAKIKCTMAVCPDPECQKKVDAQNARNLEKQLLHNKPRGKQPPNKQIVLGKKKH